MQSLSQKNKLFVHFVLDPIGFGGTSAEASFAARYGCLVTIEKVSFRGSVSLYLISYTFISFRSLSYFAGRTIRYWSIGPDKGCRSSKAIGIQKGMSF